MHVLERAELDRRRRTAARRSEARPHPLLALQAGVGNQAVARVLAQRRTIARSCDETDEAAQVALHNAYFDQCVDEGLNMIGMAMSQRRPAAAQPQPQPAASAPPPQVLPRGSRSSPPAHYRVMADDEGVYESDEDERDEPPAMTIDPRILVVVGENTVAPIGVLLQAGYPLELILRLPLYQQPADERHDEGMDEDDGGHLGRKLARNYSSNAPRPNKTKLTKVPKFTGLAPHGDNLGVLAAGVASTAKVKRRGLVTGTATDQSTRPPGWWQFIPLTGMGPKGIAHTRYIMGHLLNKDFGGLGTQMYNLSVFSARLNSHHKVQVEIPLRDFIKAAPKQHTRSIDYTVNAVYGNPANMVGDATAMFDAFLQNHRTAALAAWVKLGLIDALDAPNLLTALPTDKVALTSGATWDTVVAASRAAIAQYVTDHFPQSVTCRARMYDHGPAATDWDKTAPMDETIQHLA